MTYIEYHSGFTNRVQFVTESFEQVSDYVKRGSAAGGYDVWLTLTKDNGLPFAVKLETVDAFSTRNDDPFKVV